MPRSTIASALIAAATLSSKAHGQVYTESVRTGASGAPALATYTVTQGTGEDIPLASKVFNYPYLPYQADTGDGPRGIQTGYNICNATTEGDDSLCQTGFLNSVDDFCLWGAQQPNSVVGDVEGEMVAYCTKPGYGTRVIPAGAITGIQFTQTPGYVQVVGYIDQTTLDLQASDYGGEEDNKGADMRGNPLGSLLYTSAFGPGPSSAYKQVRDWSMFIGGGIFCFKACDPAGAQSAELCQHVYDRIGCSYNAPADYASINGTFQSCKGDNQLPAGIYVENGQTLTYQQPPESLGPITSIPYTAAIPASSQCSSFSSASLYTALASASHSTSAASSSATSAPASSGTAASRNAANNAASSARASATMSSGATHVAAVSSILFAGLGLIGTVLMA